MPASQDLPRWSGAGISHRSHEEATLVQHCSVSFGTERSYYTGRVERRARGEARGRLEMYDTTLSAVSSAASNRQDYSIFGDGPGQQSDGQKLLLGSLASSQTCLAVGAARRAQLHTSSFPKHASLPGDPLRIAGQTSSTSQAPPFSA